MNNDLVPLYVMGLNCAFPFLFQTYMILFYLFLVHHILTWLTYLS